MKRTTGRQGGKAMRNKQAGSLVPDNSPTDGRTGNQRAIYLQDFEDEDEEQQRNRVLEGGQWCTACRPGSRLAIYLRDVEQSKKCSTCILLNALLHQEFTQFAFRNPKAYCCLELGRWDEDTAV
jgi:hypothetical protein